MEELEIGTKVKYTHDGKTAKGIIHGVRRVQMEDGSERVLTYLVDTGKDERIDVHTRDPHGEEVGRRLKKAMLKDPKIRDSQELINATVEAILIQKDLPAVGLTEERFRQPEQVDVPPQDIVII